MPRYIAFFKPYGVLSSFTHEVSTLGTSHNASPRASAPRRTLSEFGLPSGVYAAGRLDFDSEGLLLLTDDGASIHRLTDPRHKLPKVYLALVEGVPTTSALERLRRGVDIQGYRTRPCQARALDAEPDLPPRPKPITPHGPTTWLELALTEGRKRQVRHMTAAIGFPTLRLVRIAIGPIRLGELRPGQWRELNHAELDSIIALQTKAHAQRKRRAPDSRLRRRRHTN
jgi:23S rRNA pseudouridine2457 synthase